MKQITQFFLKDESRTSNFDQEINWWSKGFLHEERPSSFNVSLTELLLQYIIWM